MRKRMKIRTTYFRAVSVALVVILAFLPGIERAVAAATVHATIKEVVRHYSLSDELASLSESMRIDGAYSASPTVVLSTGEEWRLHDLKRAQVDDGIILTVAFNLVDEQGRVIASAEEFSVDRFEDPNMLSGRGEVSVIERGGNMSEPLAVEATLVGVARSIAMSTYKVAGAQTEATVVNFSGLYSSDGVGRADAQDDARTPQAEARVSQFAGLAFGSPASASDGSRVIDPVITPALIGVGGAAAVAVIMIVAIVGCFLGWWCMAKPMLERLFRDDLFGEPQQGMPAFA